MTPFDDHRTSRIGDSGWDDGSGRVGLLLNLHHPRGSSMADAVRNHFEEVRLARELGFDSIAVGERYLGAPDPHLQPVPMLSSLLGPADGLIVGWSVRLIAMHSPLEIAQDAATLHALTAGRCFVGVGAGFRREEFLAAGVEPGSEGAVFRENLRVLGSLLRGEDVSVWNRRYKLENVRLDYFATGEIAVPLWVGADGPRHIDLAAQVANAWIVGPRATLNSLRRDVPRYRQLRTAASPNPADSHVLPFRRDIFIAGTFSDARDLLVHYGQPIAEQYVRWGLDLSAFSSFSSNSSDSPLVVGSAEECADQLEHYAEMLGPLHLILRFRWPGMPQKLVLESMELFARRVMPRLRAGRRVVNAP